LIGFEEKAKEHALEMNPKESCGVVVDGQYWRCRNVSDYPENDFSIEPRDYMTARTFGKIEAIVHSHPKGGEASEMDWKACRNTKIPWYIYLVPEDKWLTINP
jgi:proteasome lid subunit RPN8/RPN11